MASFDFAEPETLPEALGLLDPSDSSVRPFGGGTALMLMMKAQLFQPRRLVSLRRLGPPFTGIALSGDGTSLRIGAMTTFSELENSRLIRKHLPVVARTMRTLANVRVRNVATVGGNLGHGDPHLDLPPVWAALGAEALIVGDHGERRVPVEEIPIGYYETSIADGELIAELQVPLRPHRRASYTKVTTRAAHDWPALGIAISAEGGPDRLDDLRIVLSAAVDRPTRLLAAEEQLRGAPLSDMAIRRAGEAAAEDVELESDMRGSDVYKAHLLRVHLTRSIQALARS